MSTPARWHCTQLDGSGDLKIGKSRFSNTSFAVGAASAARADDGRGAPAGVSQPARASGRNSRAVLLTAYPPGCGAGAGGSATAADPRADGRVTPWAAR